MSARPLLMKSDSLSRRLVSSSPLWVIGAVQIVAHLSPAQSLPGNPLLSRLLLPTLPGSNPGGPTVKYAIFSRS
jgi:hypothetical protein